MPKGVPGSKAPHGTPARYQAHKCRCDACRVAWTEYARKVYKRQSKEEYEATRPRADHGTEGYARYHKCRCDACRAANAEARRRRRHANLEATRAYDRQRHRRQRRLSTPVDNAVESGDFAATCPRCADVVPLSAARCPTCRAKLAERAA